jgi:hypothetical protein
VLFSSTTQCSDQRGAAPSRHEDEASQLTSSLFAAGTLTLQQTKGWETGTWVRSHPSSGPLARRTLLLKQVRKSQYLMEWLVLDLNPESSRHNPHFHNRPRSFVRILQILSASNSGHDQARLAA